MNQMTELYEHAIKWSPHAILATVIKVEGSAYRKEGAMMLFGKDRQMGTISAGCLESDLAIQADEMLEEEIHSQTLVYDMSAEDDLGWGSGAGCNGKIHILLEHVNGLLRTNLVTALTYVAERREVNLVKILNEDRQVTDSIVSKFDDQTTFDQFTMNMKPKENPLYMLINPYQKRFSFNMCNQKNAS
ncbi:XdhC family protein [Paracerasibacillus soli]|uniref:XdhC family protein n=1 Tax=Paracerasibacillus soli TaxID=480284 RepID=A0ABU5CMY0_9BACI|nr:XdhC family protein [Virgibacillus soli]MDY0407709.1 XdhC family protein [Virgibacillus soli]